MDRRTFLARGAPLALIGLAGCSDTEMPTDTATGSPTGTAEQTPTATAEETPTATAEPTPTAADETTPTAGDEGTPTPEPDQEVVVGPSGRLRFEPESVTVSAGDTVLWRWDSSGHNVSPNQDSLPEGASWTGKDDGTFSAGTTYAHTFDTAGQYDYVCTPHQSAGMVGSVTVE